MGRSWPSPGEGFSEKGTLPLRYKTKLGLAGSHRKGKAFQTEGTAFVKALWGCGQGLWALNQGQHGVERRVTSSSMGDVPGGIWVIRPSKALQAWMGIFFFF